MGARTQPDFWAVIPARRASTRLPDKALLDIGGRPMVVRVAERAQQSRASRVMVATDDQEIAAQVAAYGIEAVLTRPDHPSGTDRIYEAAQKLNAKDDQLIVNLQGDEPFIDPQMINETAATLDQHQTASVATLATEIDQLEDLQSPHVVKLVCNGQGEALYFSRAPIPYHRATWPDLASVSLPLPRSLRHLGIYAYRFRALAAFVSWPSCAIENLEQLEQLRWLWHRHTIAVHLVDHAPHAGVDTQADLDRVRRLWAAQGSL